MVSTGLVSRVFPVDKLLEETIKLAERIGTHSPLIVKMAKQSVNQAYETTLKAGLQFEKSTFYGTFATVRFFFHYLIEILLSSLKLKVLYIYLLGMIDSTEKVIIINLIQGSLPGQLFLKY